MTQKNNNGTSEPKIKLLITSSITLVMFLLVLSTSIILFSEIANAKVIITNIDYSPTIYENQFINISFSATSNTSNVTYEIYYEGVLVGETNNYIEKTDYSYSGSYEYVIVAYDDESSVLENATIEVIDVPLIIDVKNPLDTEYFNNNISIVAYTNQDVDTSCNYVVWDKNGALNEENNPNGTGRIFSGFVYLEDGDYSINISCSNYFDSSIAERSFTVFATPVNILSTAYNVDQSNGLRLSVETDYDAECRYSVQDEDFLSMDTFSMTGNTIHSTTLNGLSEGGHKIYVGCVAHNNIVAYASLSTIISTKPTASITLEKAGTLKQGIYEVTVKTSKDVQNNPSLFYTFNNENTQRTISLAGSGNTWKGYLIIEENAGNKVGAFKFSAIDFNGITGNIITSGEIFLVDTIKPSTVSNLKAEIEDGEVLLSWSYDEDDFETFRIYRSDDGTINKNDLLKNVNTQEFIDDDIIMGETYTYMVTAVDDAGNEGLSSNEVNIQIPIDETFYYTENGNEPLVIKKLDSTLYNLVDEQISETEVLLLDIESMQKKLDSVTDATELKIIALFELDAKIKSAKSNIENVLSQLKDLKNQDLTQSELEVRLNKLKLDAIKTQSSVVEELIISEKGSFEQITQESDVESAITYMIEGVNVSKSQLKDYIIGNKRLQDQIIVKTESISYKVRNLNQENYDKRTLIYKTIISSSKIDTVSILEIIPKEVENSASDISYIKTAQPEIIKEDPVVKWDYDSLESTELYYIIDDTVPLTSLKNIRTIVLMKPDFKISDDAITGMVSFEDVNMMSLSFIHWIIIVGVGMILLLGGYYFVVLEKQDETRIKKHRIINSARTNTQSGMNTQSGTNTQFGTNNQRKINVLQNDVLTKQDLQARQKNMIMEQSRNNQKNQKTIALQKNIADTKKYSDQNYVFKPTQQINLEDKLPESIIRKIDYCNSVINMMDYERARSVYNDTVKSLPDLDDEDALKKLSHVKKKLEAYMHIHNARRHLYYKRLNHFSATIKSLNECYGTIAHNIGFMEHSDTGSEVKFLNFVADNVKQLEKNSGLLLKK